MAPAEHGLLGHHVLRGHLLWWLLTSHREVLSAKGVLEARSRDLGLSISKGFSAVECASSHGVGYDGGIGLILGRVDCLVFHEAGHDEIK